MQICLVPDGLPNGGVEKKLKGNGEEGGMIWLFNYMASCDVDMMYLWCINPIYTR